MMHTPEQQRPEGGSAGADRAVNLVSSVERPAVLLSKYFKHEQLTPNELQTVEQYRSACIRCVSQQSYRLTDIGRGISGTIPSPCMDQMARAQFSDRVGDAEDQGILEKNSMHGRTFVNLGSGPWLSIAQLVLAIGDAAAYVAVDIEDFADVDHLRRVYAREEGELRENQRIEAFCGDMLDYLTRLPNDSAIVMSSSSLIPGEVIPWNQVGRDYLRFIAREIWRVTPPGGYTYHFDYATLALGGWGTLPLDLTDEGFLAVEHEYWDSEDRARMVLQRDGLWLKPRVSTEENVSALHEATRDCARQIIQPTD